ncbi:MAG: Asd/ArgC dimerization domain-containing protein [Acidobacteria bacterium]|nr:Asd/ArgC dimerization domain-containing protein [Acidobacteriota bacterium]
MNKKKIDLKIALLGKNPILEDELINKFEKIGVDKKNVISMDDEFSQIAFDIEDEEARFYLPLESERLKDFDAVFVLNGLKLSRVDFFNKLENNVKIFIFDNDCSEIEPFEKEKFIFIPSPEVLIVSEVIKMIEKRKPKNFFWSLYESVSAKGKDGIKELFDQTRDVLNFKTPQPNVFGKQIAFNLIPRKPALSERFEKEIRKRSGFEGSLFRNVIELPIFYGTHIAFFSELGEWNENLHKDMQKNIKENKFLNFKNDISELSIAGEQMPSLYLDMDMPNCLFGFVCYDDFKMNVKSAIESLKIG